MASHGDSSHGLSERIAALTPKTSLSYGLIWLSICCLLIHYVAVAFTGFESRASLEGWREAGLIVGLLGGGWYALNRFYGNRWREMVVRVGLVGTILLLFTLIARWLVPDSVEWSDQVRLFFAYPLSYAALLYWLYRRFSNVPPAWTESSLASVAILLTIGGSAALIAATVDSNVVNTVCVGLGAPCYLIAGAHGFRALSDRNQNRVMSAPWSALCLILLVVGGLLSVTMLSPNADLWTHNATLADVPHEFVSAAGIALILGMGNQIAAELRGQNIRVTGWVPYWLVTGGTLLTVLGLAAVGLVESVLIRLEIALIGEWIAPLAAIWWGGVCLISAGLAIYALTYFLRRPPSIGAPDYRPRR